MITENFTSRLERVSCPEKVKASDIPWLIGIAKAALALSSKMVDTEEFVDDVATFDAVEEEWFNLTKAFMGK